MSIAFVLAACTKGSEHPDPPPPPIRDAAPAPAPEPQAAAPDAGAPASLRAFMLTYGHWVRSSVVVPGKVWVATREELLELHTNQDGVASAGVRSPFQGILGATPDGLHLFRYDDRELVALDASGHDTALRFTLGAKIGGLIYSRASHLVGALAGDELTVFRVSDLHPIASASLRGAVPRELASSSDDTYITLDGKTYDTKTGKAVTATPAGTLITDHPGEEPAGATPSSELRFSPGAVNRWVARSPYTGGFEFTKADYAPVALRDGELVVGAGKEEVHVRVAPPGTRAVMPTDFTIPPTYSEYVVGQLGGRIVLRTAGDDISIIDARTHAETEHYYFTSSGIFHIRDDGMWETTGDASQVERYVLCTDGVRVEPPAACKYVKH